MDWKGSAFVVTPGDVPITLVPPHVTKLFIQVAEGLTPRQLDPSRLLLLAQRFELHAWAWCNGFKDGGNPEDEARLHGRLAREGGYRSFVANMEEPYDAHGGSGDGRFLLPGRYLAALGLDMPLGVTTTPLFGSHMGDWQLRGAVVLPQSFPTAAEGGKSVSHVYSHAKAWGWHPSAIRPLVQTYAGPSGRPNADEQNAEALALGIGVTPYTLEQAVEESGLPAIDKLRASIDRATIVTKKEEEIVALIGSQHGITALTNHMRAVWPTKTNRNRDPNNMTTWGAIDKYERTLLMLASDHDADEARGAIMAGAVLLDEPEEPEVVPEHHHAPSE